jgi:16S rRNA (adenine1518-N6/adenine1519-N6)-dimethyltransferase
VAAREGVAGTPREPAPRSCTRRLLDAYGIRPKKSLGQHFVADPNTLRRIVALAGVGQESRVLEVGAGLGALTQALATTGARVLAIEVDPRLVRLLEEKVAGERVRVVEADATSVDWEGLLGGESKWVLVANLPYNVATPVVMRVLEEAPSVERLLVMVQREVGERFTATRGDPAYGAVSVKIAYFCKARVVGRVPPSVFVPMPRVESVLVEMVRRDALAAGSGDVPYPALAAGSGDVPYRSLAAVVNAGFSKRRKMLRSSLAGLLGREPTEQVLHRAGIEPTKRAEDLELDDWCKITWCARASGTLQKGP